MSRHMLQTALYPETLADLVAELEYKAGWTFTLAPENRGQGSAGLTLTIEIVTPNGYNPAETRRVAHYFIVPAAAYDRRSWQRWLLEQILLVESHETCEFFTVDAVKPYAPSRGPGNDPYMIREIGTIEDVRTSFRGEMNS